MSNQRAISNAFDSPGLVSSKLPPKIVDRAVGGLFWVLIFTAVTSVTLNVMKTTLQPEFARVAAHPVLRITSLAILFLCAGIMVVQKTGWLRKDQLLDLGLFFQVAIAFACGLFEAAAYTDPDSVVLGVSAIAPWMLLCGLLMPKAPARAALSAVLCMLMWPLAHWVDRLIFGLPAIPTNRLLVWILPLGIMGVWMYILNNRVLSFYVKQQRMEDIGSYTLTARLGSGGMGEVWKARHKMLAREAAIKVGSSRVDLQACKLEYSIVSPK